MTKRVAKDKKWIYNSKYGDLIITINLSKPEKDPRDIAAALGSTSSNYPKCQLCVENEGFEGNLSHPARANHRMIPVEINGENWYFQYSPYVYYNEHSILLYEKHVPMKTDIMTFRRLLGFVSKFKHYFIGSNADLPIVGGSILTHDHFQGGRADFPMSEAGVGCELRFEDFPEVSVGIVKWPLSTLRLSGNDCEELAMLGEKILKVWRGYSDLTCDIVAITDQPHNTVTPIARFRDGRYELDLILRNNRTSSEHPLGIFHPHSEYHHIKKENIGLIEAMGLAVLPSRLVNEFDVESDIVRSKIGEVFEGILENCGVYKETMAGKEGFMKFVATCGGCVVG